MPTLVGHLAVFNEWAEINSVVEGHFLSDRSGRVLEAIAGGIRCGCCSARQGPQVGISRSAIRSLEVDEGLAYEVDTRLSYNRDIVAMLAATLLCSDRVSASGHARASTGSGAFETIRARLPERTVQEVKMQNSARWRSRPMPAPVLVSVRSLIGCCSRRSGWTPRPGDARVHDHDGINASTNRTSRRMRQYPGDAEVLKTLSRSRPWRSGRRA
jgi:hypothetical protein